MTGRVRYTRVGMMVDSHSERRPSSLGYAVYDGYGERVSSNDLSNAVEDIKRARSCRDQIRLAQKISSGFASERKRLKKKDFVKLFERVLAAAARSPSLKHFFP